MCDTCGCSSEHHHHEGEVRTVEVRQNVLATNDGYAKANRERLDASKTVAFNLISSPGAGKTTLLESTIRKLGNTVPLAVIEGDLQTDRDAARIRETGAQVYQINTGEGCHLDAHMVGHAMDHLTIPKRGVLFIENVGNLVCPASFELGEAYRVVVLSVAEGDDKVEKYPSSFRRADLLIINKVDLIDHVDFSIEQCRETMKALNPKALVLELSARTGTGIDDFCEWVRSKIP
jgi:hydrogenase nickel incorporation protein HypB